MLTTQEIDGNACYLLHTRLYIKLCSLKNDVVRNIFHEKELQKTFAFFPQAMELSRDILTQLEQQRTFLQSYIDFVQTNLYEFDTLLKFSKELENNLVKNHII